MILAITQVKQLKKKVDVNILSKNTNDSFKLRRPSFALHVFNIELFI